MQLNYHKIIEDLEREIAGEIVYDRKTLEAHATDASLFKVMPQLVIYPKDKFDISAIVKYVANLKKSEGERYKQLSITARAAGTCMSGGSLNDSIILDVTKYLNKIITPPNLPLVRGGIEPQMSVVCEPGLYYRDLEKEMDKLDVFYPSYPASKDLCCIGGIVSNNSSGEKTLSYGSTKDWIEEIEAVLSDGSIFTFKKVSFEEFKNMRENVFVQSIYSDIFDLIEKNKDLIEAERPKVSKNSSGYFLWEVIDWDKKTVDLCKLLCGSQGTLAIVTKVKLKLVPKKKYVQMLTVFLPDLKKLVPLVEELLPYAPESLESYDDHTFSIAMKFLPTIIWKLKGSLWQLAWNFVPEAWMVLTGGIPKLVILAEFTGSSQQEANQKADLASRSIKKFGLKQRVTRNELDISKYWLFRRESFNLLRSKLKDFRTAPFVEDTIVPIECMKEFIPEMEKLMDKYKMIYTIAGHAGNGNFHIIPLMKLKSEKEVLDIESCGEEVFALIQKYKGSISAEHNDGLVRTPYLHFMFGKKMLSLFAETKEIFDSLGIFNPGKKVGGSVVENYKKVNIIK